MWLGGTGGKTCHQLVFLDRAVVTETWKNLPETGQNSRCCDFTPKNKCRRLHAQGALQIANIYKTFTRTDSARQSKKYMCRVSSGSQQPQRPVHVTATSLGKGHPRTSSSATRIFAKACPYVSWKCIAALFKGTSATFKLSMRARVLPAVPTPIVSPSDTE